MKVVYSPGIMTSQDLSKVSMSYFGNNKFIVFALLSYQLLLPDRFNEKPLYSYTVTAFSLQTPSVLVIQHCNVYSIFFYLFFF